MSKWAAQCGRARCCATAAALGTLAFISGCADAPPQSAPPIQTSPGLRTPGVGITLNRWVIDDNPFDDNLSTGEAPRAFGPNTRPLADVLAPYLNRPVPVNRASRERWHANGLRLVSVPRADLEKVRETLRLVGPMHQQLIGESHVWMELLDGPQWSGSESITLDDGDLSLGSGSLRLLMRCWIGPALPTMSQSDAPKLPSGSIPGAVQVELVPQHLPPAERDDIGALLRPKPTLVGEGVVLPRLSIEASCATDDVLLIVPEHPDVQWKPRTVESEAGGAADIEAQIRHAGPPLPGSITLGELMMTDYVLGGHRNMRVVLVIEPMPPRTFNLLGR